MVIIVTVIFFTIIKFLSCCALILRRSHLLLLLSKDYMRVLGLNKELIFLLLMKVAHEFKLSNMLSELTVPQL